MMPDTESIKEIELVLEQFNEAYTVQDDTKIDEFMKKFYTDSDSSVIIGTAYKEWKYGSTGAKELFINDWKEPGVWSYDYKDAKISVKGSVSWVSLTGKLTMELPASAVYQWMLAQIKNKVDDEDQSPDDKMWDIIGSATFYLNQTKKGDKYVLPFRFTAVLIKENDYWLFHQMHFSFPYLIPSLPVRVFE